MLTEFIQKKLKSARYKLLEDGTYFGEIPSAHGVWANTKNLEACRTQLREVFEDWLLLQVRTGVKLPGLRLKLPSNYTHHGKCVAA